MTDKAIEHLQLEIKEKDKTISCIIESLQAKTKECDELISGKDFYLQKIETLEEECEKLKKQLMQKSEVDMFFNTPVEGWDNDPCKICKYKNEYQRYEQALDEVLSIATNSDMLPCADFEVDCTKCKDRIKEKGKRCMRYGLIKIKNVVEKAKDGK